MSESELTIQGSHMARQPEVQVGETITWNGSVYRIQERIDAGGYGYPKFVSRKSWTRARAAMVRSPFRKVFLKAVKVENL